MGSKTLVKTGVGRGGLAKCLQSLLKVNIIGIERLTDNSALGAQRFEHLEVVQG